MNARTEPDVEMEGDVNYTVGGREKDREAEKERSNRSNNKGKSKDVPVDNEKEQPMPSHLRNRHTPKPKSTGRPAQAGSWNDIKSCKKNASTKSRTFLHAQVASPFAIFCSCSRNAQVDVDDDGTEDDEDKVIENKRRKPSGQRTDDDDNDSDGDEGDICLSAHKLKKVMADIMHDVFNEKSPRRGRLQSKKSKALRDEKKLDEKWERKSFCVSHYVDGEKLIQI